MKKKLIKFIQIAIGILILGMLFWKVGIDNFFSVLKTVNLFWLCLAFLVTIITQSIGTLNIYVLLKAINKKISLWKLFRIHTLSYSIGMIAPGKLGDFSILWFLKNEGIGYGKGLAVTVVDKLISLAVVSVIALIGIWVYFGIRLFLVILGFLLIGFILGIYLLVSKGSRCLITKYVLRKHAKYFEGFYKTINIIQKNKEVVVINLLLTIFKIALQSITIFFVLVSLDVYINILIIAIITSIITILMLIPITFSGLGIREITGTYLYNHITSLDIQISLSLMVILTMLRYVTSLLFYIINFNLLKINNLTTSDGNSLVKA